MSATARRARGSLGEEFFDRPVAALWSGVALVVVVIIIGLLLPAGPLGVDRSWSEWMRDTQTHALHQLALVFNWLGRESGARSRWPRSALRSLWPGGGGR